MPIMVPLRDKYWLQFHPSLLTTHFHIDEVLASTTPGFYYGKNVCDIILLCKKPYFITLYITLLVALLSNVKALNFPGYSSENELYPQCPNTVNNTVVNTSMLDSLALVDFCVCNYRYKQCEHLEIDYMSLNYCREASWLCSWQQYENLRSHLLAVI